MNKNRFSIFRRIVQIENHKNGVSSPFNDCTSASPVHLMSLSTFLIGILVLALVAPLQAHPLIPSGNSQNNEYKRYCSNSLSDVLRELCGGRTSLQQNGPYPNIDSTFGSSTLNRLANDDDFDYRKAQVERVLECCLRPCGYAELKMYCAPI